MQLLHDFDCDFDRLLGIRTMHVVQIDVVRLQTLQRFGALLTDVIWFVADRALAGLGVDVVGEFGGEEDCLASAGVAFEPSEEDVVSR